MLWMVTMKLIAPASDAIEVRWIPRIHRSCPMSGLPSSRESEKAREEDDAAHEEEPVRQGVEPREGDVARADHERDEVVAEARQDRDDEEEDHRRPVHGEELRVAVLRDEVVLGLRKLQAHEQRHQPGGEEEAERGDDVEDADPLVVDRRHPAHDAAFLPRGCERLATDRHSPVLP